MSRVETGKVQVGDDWPGVFIRGDNAIYYGRTLRAYLTDPNAQPMARAVLDGLVSTLLLAEARNGVEPIMLQKVE